MNGKTRILAAVIAVAAVIGAGCMWYEEEDDHDACSYGCNPGPYYEWLAAWADFESGGVMDVGFGCGYCCLAPALADGGADAPTPRSDILSRNVAVPDNVLVEGGIRPENAAEPAAPLSYPADVCGYDNWALSEDTVYFDEYDLDMVDLQLNFWLDNYSNEYIKVYIDLCDYDSLGTQYCGDYYDDYYEIIMYPGESWGERTWFTALDNALRAYDDCVADLGSSCTMSYPIDVYLGEECMCIPVGIDYYFDGLYLH